MQQQQGLQGLQQAMFNVNFRQVSEQSYMQQQVNQQQQQGIIMQQQLLQMGAGSFPEGAATTATCDATVYDTYKV